MAQSRTSFESESNFSLIDHGYANESVLSGQSRRRNSPLARSHGSTSDGRVNSYCRCMSQSRRKNYAQVPTQAISTIMNAASAGPNLATTLNNLNPLRPTGPKTGATRGKPAAPIVLSELPKVSRRDFDAYVDNIKEDYTTWSRLQAAIAEPRVLDELDSGETVDEEQAKRKNAIAYALEGSSGLGQKGHRRKELPPLESIPHIFFEENFNLANPHTFDVVTAGATAGGQAPNTRTSSGTIRSETSSTDVSTDQILQEKLTHYLDIVEVHLSVEISLRSASFFSALSNLQALDSQSAEALKQITSLKEMLGAVDETVAKKGLEKVRQGVRRRRLNDLDLAMERVKEILRAVEQAEDMGEAGETQGALDLADELQTEWEASLLDSSSRPPDRPPLSVDVQVQPTLMSIGEEDEDSPTMREGAAAVKTPFTAASITRNGHYPPVRIAKIKALASVPARLATLRSAIAQTLEAEVIAVLVHELRETLVIFQSAEKDWKEVKDGQVSLEGQAKASLINRAATIVAGLVRCGKPAMDGVVAAWRDAMLRELRRTLRELLPQNISSSLAEEDDGLWENSPSSRSSMDGGRPSLDGAASSLSSIRSMPHETYLRTIRSIHAAMLGCISIADIQSQAIHLLVSGVSAPSSPSRHTSHKAEFTASAAFNEAWLTALQSDLSDVVLATAELANVRLAKLVSSRAEVHTLLSLEEFIVVFNESWQFVLNCEVVCRKMIVGLRGVIVGQAKSFLQTFHQKHLSEAAHLVETEQWSPADVPAFTQAVVERILESAVRNPPGWELSRMENDGKIDMKLGKSAKHILIEDRTYFAVAASIKAVDYLEEYLKVVINLPLLTMDAMSRIIEFLKQFNSRVCQVVLGAGAMRSAGLKNITAKHLALASQSLSIIISLIPYVRECLRRHLRAKQAVILVDFDKLKRDYQEHQYEIHAKLVAIMGDRLAVHCKTLQSIDWEAPSGKKAGTPNAYMETLVKEAATLHKVLHKYLPGTALETVMMQVLSAISARLAEEYSGIEICSDAARERILDDAKYMRSKFGEMKGLERAVPGAELEELVKMKRVETPAPAPPAKPFTTPALTRSRTSFSHRRTPSSASVSKIESATPVAVMSAVTTPDLATAVEKKDPLDIKTDITPHTSTQDQLEEVKPAVEADNGVAGPLLPEMVPLPLSPVLEADDASFIPVSDIQPEPTAPAAIVPDVEKAPATPVKEVNERETFSPPLPEKLTSPPPTTKSPPPAPVSNVKNRLAGLFNKRPTASLPKMELPKVTIPHIALPNLLSERLMSPERQAGSPAQAKSSLDLPRARALMEKQEFEQELGKQSIEQRLPAVTESGPDSKAQQSDSATIPVEETALVAEEAQSAAVLISKQEAIMKNAAGTGSADKEATAPGEVTSQDTITLGEDHALHAASESLPAPVEVPSEAATSLEADEQETVDKSGREQDEPRQEVAEHRFTPASEQSTPESLDTVD